MKHLPTLLAASLPLASSAALPFTVDDFGGGPHVVDLIGLAPPEIALGSFAYGGAVGGIRDVVVISESIGVFSAGISFSEGGYSSFAGTGRGGIVWDGVAGITDVDADVNITAADLDYGLSLDLGLADCPPALVFIKISAFADLPDAKLDLIFATSATDYNEYIIDLTTVGAFADYMVSFFAPTVAVGTFDPSNVNAIALFHDGGDFPNLDIRANEFEVVCVPEARTWTSAIGLASLVTFGAWRRRLLPISPLGT